LKTMLRTRVALLCCATLLIAISPAYGQTADNTCIACHEQQRMGFHPGHAFAAADCTVCHAGDPAADAGFSRTTSDATETDNPHKLWRSKR